MYLSKFNFLIAGAALCALPLLAAGTQPVIHTAAEQAKRADRLLREMKAEAQTINSHAAELEKLAKDPNTQWAQFDQEWNEIKPAQEMLESHMWALDSMRASLTDAQRTALDQTKQAAPMIAARTRELIRLIDKPGANLRSPQFRSYAQSLAQNAATVAHASTSGV